jgi:hypothetical protein
VGRKTTKNRRGKITLKKGLRPPDTPESRSLRAPAPKDGRVGKKDTGLKQGDGVNATEKRNIIICVTNLSKLAHVSPARRMPSDRV